MQKYWIRETYFEPNYHRCHQIVLSCSWMQKNENSPFVYLLYQHSRFLAFLYNTPMSNWSHHTLLIVKPFDGKLWAKSHCNVIQNVSSCVIFSGFTQPTLSLLFCSKNAVTINQLNSWCLGNGQSWIYDTRAHKLTVSFYCGTSSFYEFFHIMICENKDDIYFSFKILMWCSKNLNYSQ